MKEKHKIVVRQEFFGRIAGLLAEDLANENRYLDPDEILLVEALLEEFFIAECGASFQFLLESSLRESPN